MLSMAPVGSAAGAAKYFAADNYYTLDENTEESLWFGEGAELLGLAPSDAEGDVPEGVSEAASEDVEEPEKGAKDGPEETDLEAGDVLDNSEAAEESEAPGGASAEAETETDTEPGPSEAKDAGNAGSHVDGAQINPEGIEGNDDVPIDAPFDPDVAEGGSTPAVAPTGTRSIDADAGETIPFDPDRAGGLPEGVSLPPPASLSSTPANKMPLSNPSGKVDPKTFENILNGILPDGTQVGKAGDRRLGMDLTFSMPKSASLLAYIGGDKRILAAHMGAVKTAMKWVEGNLAETRVRDEKGQHPVKTGNLVYALFQHDTSRALDPQGHIHAVIANITRLPNGEWRSLHNGEIWRNNTVTSSVYHAAFRDALEKLGYEVDLEGKHGTFEIVGVPKGIRDAFSQRREAILAKSAEIGIATPQGMREVTKNTRDAKINVKDHDALLETWVAKADELGWQPAPLIDAAKRREGHEPGLLERGATAIDGAMRDARVFVSELLRGSADPLIDKGLARLRLTSDQARTQVAVASAIRILGQREAAFGVYQVMKTALDLGLRRVTPEGINKRMTELIKADQLVPGVSDRRDNVVTMITTREAITTELAIIGEIDKGKGAATPALTPEQAFARIADGAGDRPLNDEQTAAAVAILTSKDRITAIQGDAGSGKSTMLRPVADILKADGHKVIGLAFQTKVASALREETGIEAMTVAKFLIVHQGVLEGDKAATKESRETLAGTHIFLDEASMISNDQMRSLTTITNATGANLRQIGDRKQLLPIDSGKSFALSQAGGVATTRMTENLRQKTPELRAAAALSMQGRTGDAIRLLGDVVHASDDRNADAAEWWLAFSASERDTAAVFTSGKESRAAINESVQEGLRQEGTLTGDVLSLRVTEAVDRTREEMRYAQSYLPGLNLEVWRDVAKAGLRRGEYRVTRVFNNGKVELERDGKRMKFKPEHIPTGLKDDRLKLSMTKDVEIQEGERIRWTTNDRDRNLLNGTLSKVLRIDGGNVTIEQPDKTVLVLEKGDPMLQKLDLAYALNMNMAQGMTANNVAVVIGSTERFLANQRLAHVGLTRVREDLKVFTDDKDKLIRQIDRTSGNKTSALETTGQLQVDQDRTTAGVAKEREKPFDPGPVASDLSLLSDRDRNKGPLTLDAALGPLMQSPDRSAIQLTAPEKTKELDL